VSRGFYTALDSGVALAGAKRRNHDAAFRLAALVPAFFMSWLQCASCLHPSSPRGRGVRVPFMGMVPKYATHTHGPGSWESHRARGRGRGVAQRTLAECPTEAAHNLGSGTLNCSFSTHISALLGQRYARWPMAGVIIDSMEPSGFPETGVSDVEWWVSVIRQSVQRGVIFDPTILELIDPGKLPAEAIIRVLSNFRSGQALRIRSADISGELPLSRFAGDLSITESSFDHPVSLAGATFGELNFAGSHLPELKILYCTSKGDINLAGATIDGPLVISAGSIKGSLVLDRVEVKGRGHLDSLHVSQSVTIRRAHLYSGLAVRSLSAETLDLSGSKLNGETALALEECRFDSNHLEESEMSSPRNVEAVGFVDLRNVEAIGRVDIWHTRGRVLDLSNATLLPYEENVDNFTLSLDTLDGHKKLPSTFADDHRPDNILISPYETHASSATKFYKILTDGLLIVGSVDEAAQVVRKKDEWQTRFLNGLSLAATNTFSTWPVVAVAALVAFAVLGLSGPTAITDPIHTISTGLFIAAVSGILSCTVLENLKRLLRLRGLYQMLSFRTWLNHRLGDRDVGLRAYGEFIVLTGATVSPRFPTGTRMPVTKQPHALANLRLFDLPIEQLAAQLFDVTETVLSNPKKYRFLCLAMAGMDYPFGHLNEAKVAEFESRARRSVDHMQITIGDGWRRYLVGAATGLSGAAGILFVEMYEVQDPRLTVILATFVGGFLAWLTRDLSAGVSKFRR
jgi:hypothetical protein